MKGVLFNIVEEIVVELFDDDTWDGVLDAAGVDGAFTALGNYEDADLVAIAAAVADATNQPVPEVWQLVGRLALPKLDLGWLHPIPTPKIGPRYLHPIETLGDGIELGEQFAATSELGALVARPCTELASSRPLREVLVRLLVRHPFDRTNDMHLAMQCVPMKGERGVPR